MNKATKDRIKKFVADRDWDQYHNPKDLALAISIEASELLENYLWKDAEQADFNGVKEEIADILIYVYMLMSKYGLDCDEIINEKLSINEEKYPVDKSKGKAIKWNKL